MKIAIIGKFSMEEMGSHISNTLRQMGHTVFEIEFGPELKQNKNNQQNFWLKAKVQSFNLAINLKPQLRRWAFNHILKQLCSPRKLDLIISTHDWLTYLEIKEIKKHSDTKIMLWFPDGIINFNKAYFMTAGYDFLCFKDPYIVRHLKVYYGFKNVFFLPEAFNPSVHKPVPFGPEDQKEFGCDISMVGNLHSFRVPILEKLVSENKFKIKIYGGRAPFYIPISDTLKKSYTNIFAGNETKSKAIQYSKISLNTLHMGEVESANVRVFEIAGIGGFQLTAHRKGLENLFKVGKEIETYTSYKDLVEKIEYYLHHEEERQIIARNGRARALKDHTYEIRLKKLINIVKGKQLD